MKKSFFLITIFSVIAPSFIFGQITLTLKEYATKNNMNIGIAYNNGFFNFDTTQTYVQTVRKEFNTLVAENNMKFDAMEPNQNQFAFSNTDKMIAFAERNGLKVRGHCLIWHSQVPSWVSSGNFTRNQLLDVMKNHIITVVKRYKGRIYEWDVLNEAVLGNGTLRKSSNTSTTKDISKWNEVIGDDYIDSAFVWARQADSSALLFYNDYGAENMGTKSEAIYQMVKSMKARGIPIDGVGFQCHFEMGTINFTDIERNIQRIQALGLKVAITELDIRMSNSLIPGSYNQQATDYARLLSMCIKYNISTFMIWGFSDDLSWIPAHTSYTKGGALIFDKDYQRKPAFYALVDTLAATYIRKQGKNPTTNGIEGIFVYGNNGVSLIENNNASLQIKAHIIPSTFQSKDVVWNITNGTGTATIDNTGLLKAITNGTVKITAVSTFDNKKIGVTTLKLSGQYIDVESVSLSAATNNISSLKGTLQINTLVLPANAQYKTLTWTSSRPDIATVSSEGLVTAIGNDDVTITATSIDGSKISADYKLSISGQPVGIGIEKNILLQISPNPALNILNINSPVVIEELEIYTINGLKIVSYKANAQILSIDCSGFQSGVYFIMGKTSKGLLKTIFIKN